jgi:hypothetical protein
MDYKKVGREDVDWIELAQDITELQDTVKTVMELRVP